VSGPDFVEVPCSEWPRKRSLSTVMLRFTWNCCYPSCKAPFPVLNCVSSSDQWLPPKGRVAKNDGERYIFCRATDLSVKCTSPHHFTNAGRSEANGKTPRSPTEAFLTSGEWSASRPSRFTPEVRAPRTHRVGGWVGPRAGLDAVAKRRTASGNWTSVIHAVV
jgi:hypothetical protein